MLGRVWARSACLSLNRQLHSGLLLDLTADLIESDNTWQLHASTFNIITYNHYIPHHQCFRFAGDACGHEHPWPGFLILGTRRFSVCRASNAEKICHGGDQRRCPWSTRHSCRLPSVPVPGKIAASLDEVKDAPHAFWVIIREVIRCHVTANRVITVETTKHPHCTSFRGAAHVPFTTMSSCNYLLREGRQHVAFAPYVDTQ